MARICCRGGKTDISQLDGGKHNNGFDSFANDIELGKKAHANNNGLSAQKDTLNANGGIAVDKSKQEKLHQHRKSPEKQLLQKKKKTTGNKNHDMMGHDSDRQMEDESSSICRLCNREQPLYFY